MSDFPRRTDEILKDLEELKTLLPEQALQNFTSAVARYKSWRAGVLDELLGLLNEGDDDPQERAWQAKCADFSAKAADHFEECLKNITLATEAAAKGYRWQLTLMANEGKFFETLGKVNAAAVRDYLCIGRESLRTYTETLDQKWRAIVEEGNKLQADEKRIYDEMVSTSKRIIDELSLLDATMKEQMAKTAAVSLFVIEKSADFFSPFLDVPEVAGPLAEKAAELLREKLQAWIEFNTAQQNRVGNYRALLQAEKGGVLPLFKETRRQVYDYWDKNNLDRARDWIARFKQSLESDWISGCPTPGQQADAKEFYALAFERVEKHFKAVEELAKQFETKWNGVFKGALAPKTIDELTDNDAWRMNAETLVSIRTPEVINKLFDQLDGYYEESLVSPLNRLKEKANELLEPESKQAAAAADLAKKRIVESIRARITQFRSEVGASLRWFEPDEIRKQLDRDELKGALE